jgi:hypothetical protein
MVAKKYLKNKLVVFTDSDGIKKKFKERVSRDFHLSGGFPVKISQNSLSAVSWKLLINKLIFASSHENFFY